MQHFFGQIVDNRVILSPEDEHHLVHVKRAQVGEEIEVGADGCVYLCMVASVYPLKIEKKIALPSRELPYRLGIAFGVLKSEHSEWLVQKSTELGATSFYPCITERCVVRPKVKKDPKWERLQKIANESAKQCRRGRLPELSAYQSWNEILALPYPNKILAYENESLHGDPLLYALEEMKMDDTLFVIGPEGGFTPAEVEQAQKAGFRIVSLGKRILRAETAGLYGACLIGSMMEKRK